jgi:hypothetical protein
MENLLSQLTTSWDGLLILTGDININLLKSDAHLTKQYLDLLSTFDLTQHVQKATRITQTTTTLIDHIISNNPKRVTHTDVLPCSSVSDHDAPYACVNIRTERFQPRFKYIRSERHFKKNEYIQDFESLPFNIIYAIDDPDEKLEVFNKLIAECIEHHAPLKRTNITRPPAPWLHDDNIRDLQNQRDSLRREAHTFNTTAVWQAFRDVRNQLKIKIKEAKKSFVNKAFSSSKPKEIWRVIHRVLNPSPQPLRVDVDELNEFFASTAQRTTGNGEIDVKEDLLSFVDSLQPSVSDDAAFHLRQVTLS